MEAYIEEQRKGTDYGNEYRQLENSGQVLYRACLKGTKLAEEIAEKGHHLEDGSVRYFTQDHSEAGFRMARRLLEVKGEHMRRSRQQPPPPPHI